MQLIQTKDIENISVSDICKLCKLNRSTFYSNYIDIYDLVENVRVRMEQDFASIYTNDNSAGHNPDSYLKMFRHIKENQMFYKTYFKLNFDTNNNNITHFDKTLAKKYYNNKYIDYHCEFFRAGFSAILRKWLASGCKESPEEMLEILLSEYEK